MSNESNDDPTQESGGPAPDEERGPAELVALGIGCLVVVVFFGAVLLAAWMGE